MFLRLTIHGPKRAGRIVTRKKGRGTNRQGTANQTLTGRIAKSSHKLKHNRNTEIDISSAVIISKLIGHYTRNRALKALRLGKLKININPLNQQEISSSQAPILCLLYI